MEKIETLKHLNLTDGEKVLASSIINNHGSGQHPWADSENIVGFAIDYLSKLISKLYKKNLVNELTEEGKNLLLSIEDKIKQYNSVTK